MRMCLHQSLHAVQQPSACRVNRFWFLVQAEDRRGEVVGWRRDVVVVTEQRRSLTRDMGALSA
jgi:hypothetical protein